VTGTIAHLPAAVNLWGQTRMRIRPRSCRSGREN
jgi:hypothetical protein